MKKILLSLLLLSGIILFIRCSNEVDLYADYKETQEKQSMGFQMSNWDDKLLNYGAEFEKNMMDHEIVVRNEDAKNMADRLCKEEGLFCGMSSGANVYAAIAMAKKMKKGSKIVTVLVDRRDRYFAEYPNEHYVV